MSHKHAHVHDGGNIKTESSCCNGKPKPPKEKKPKKEKKSKKAADPEAAGKEGKDGGKSAATAAAAAHEGPTGGSGKPSAKEESGKGKGASKASSTYQVTLNYL